MKKLIKSFALTILSIYIFVSIATYSPTHKSLNTTSNAITNAIIQNKIGHYLSDFLIQIFGISSIVTCYFLIVFIKNNKVSKKKYALCTLIATISLSGIIPIFIKTSFANRTNYYGFTGNIISQIPDSIYKNTILFMLLVYTLLKAIIPNIQTNNTATKLQIFKWNFKRKTINIISSNVLSNEIDEQQETQNQTQHIYNEEECSVIEKSIENYKNQLAEKNAEEETINYTNDDEFEQNLHINNNFYNKEENDEYEESDEEKNAYEDEYEDEDEFKENIYNEEETSSQESKLEEENELTNEIENEKNENKATEYKKEHQTQDHYKTIQDKTTQEKLLNTNQKNKQHAYSDADNLDELKKQSVYNKINAIDIIPSINLLDEHAKEQNIDNEEEALENAVKLEVVLLDFGIKGKIINITTGPIVTLYELEPAPGIKSSRIIGLSADIARSLSAISVRIAIIPGKNVIGIEIPNKKKQIIDLKTVLSSNSYVNTDYKLPLALGVTINGEVFVADLTKMPHLLIAGTTGSGKSVAINTMIMSLIYSLSYEECKFIMIDPKMLELSHYNDLPHLIAPVVTDSKKAVIALKWVVDEMESRYKLMSKIGVRNIDGYNNKIIATINANKSIIIKKQIGFDENDNAIFKETMVPLKKMPNIIVIVDEMADLMLLAGKEIESLVQRLAQMARAAGIHIIMATQRPSVDVITGVIKANFPTRISFAVTSKIDSRTILGEQGAESLLGMGDMLYMGNGTKIQRLHGPFVSDLEIHKVLENIKNQSKPQYIESLIDLMENYSNNTNDIIDDSDDIYSKAVQIIKNDKKASISYLQRKLRIGFNRAASIIERMEKEGIISQQSSTGKRTVL